MNEILVDKEGYEQFYKKLEELKNMNISNATEMSNAYKDYVGDGWHDNPLYEEASRMERLISNNIQKMINKQKFLKIVEDKYDEKLVNINDVIEVEFIYSKDDVEKDIIKLTGNYIPNTDLEINEITLNSPIGKAIYKKKIGNTYSYQANGNNIKIKILNRRKN